MRILKRALLTCFALVILITSLPLRASAASSVFAGGSGTAYDPYLITTKKMLAQVGTYCGYFKLMNNLRFTEKDFAPGGDFYNNGNGWKPLNLKNEIHFYGNHRVIEGIVSRHKTNHSFISSIGKNSTVYGLYLRDYTIDIPGSTETTVSFFADKNEGTVDMCSLRGTMTCSGNIRNVSAIRDNSGLLRSFGNGAKMVCRSTYDGELTLCGVCIQNDGSDYYKLAFNSGFSGSWDVTSKGGQATCAGVCYTNSNLMSSCFNSGDLTNQNTEQPFQYIAGVAFRNDDLMDSCTNSADIYCAESADISVAGIVNRNNGTLISCSNEGSITGFPWYAAGIALHNSMIIKNCINTGAISGYQIGGIAYNGCDADNAVIQDCINHAPITGVAIKSYLYASTAGGITAVAENVGLIRRCENYGEISASIAGGISGDLFVLGSQTPVPIEVKGCFNTGRISSNESRGISTIGGIVGTTATMNSNVVISDCYNLGEVASGAAERYNLGGLVGNLKSDETSGFTSVLQASYSTGPITADAGGGSSVGLAIGLVRNYLETSDPVVSSVFALERGLPMIGEINSHIDAAELCTNVSTRTKAQMAQEIEFPGFNFDSSWSMSDSLGRPVLLFVSGDNVSDWDANHAPTLPGTVRISATAVGNGQAMGSIRTVPGASVELTAYAADDATFLGWYCNGKLYAETETILIEAKNSMDFYASFSNNGEDRTFVPSVHDSDSSIDISLTLRSIFSENLEVLVAAYSEDGQFLGCDTVSLSLSEHIPAHTVLSIPTAEADSVVLFVLNKEKSAPLQDAIPIV